jgi:nicotinamidase-related amidase
MRPDRKGDTFASNPRLADELRARDVGTIVAFGIQSECCVLSTSLGALSEGFEVAVLSGAHSTYDADGKAAVLIEREVEHVLEHEGAKIVEWKTWTP